MNVVPWLVESQVAVDFYFLRLISMMFSYIWCPDSTFCSALVIMKSLLQDFFSSYVLLKTKLMKTNKEPTKRYVGFTIWMLIYNYNMFCTEYTLEEHYTDKHIYHHSSSIYYNFEGFMHRSFMAAFTIFFWQERKVTTLMLCTNYYLTWNIWFKNVNGTKFDNSILYKDTHKQEWSYVK